VAGLRAGAGVGQMQKGLYDQGVLVGAETAVTGGRIGGCSGRAGVHCEG
jgi:hypothetical protein